jgi:hypothetical protein
MGAWMIVPAADLVPGDMVKLSLGGVVGVSTGEKSYSTIRC